MSGFRPAWLLLTPILLVCFVTLAAETHQQEGAAMISRASAIVNLEGPGSPPFYLLLHFKVLTLASGPADGRYQLIWVNDNKWREELSFSGFEAIEVGGDGKRRGQRNADFTPKPAFEISTLMENLWHLPPAPGEKVSKISHRSEHHVKSACVDVEGGEYSERTLCFDDSGSLASVDLVTPVGIYEYSAYASFGSKVFPRKMRVSIHGVPVIDADVQELLAQDSVPDPVFAPPRGATAYSSCAHPVRSGPVVKVPPVYPTMALRQGRQGTVAIYAVIGADGSVQKATVIGSAGKDFDDSALDAIKRWKYSPYMCGSTPVSAETEIDVNFVRY